MHGVGAGDNASTVVTFGERLLESLTLIEDRLAALEHRLPPEVVMRSDAQFRINASSLIVPSPAGSKRIYVTSYLLVADGAVSVRFAGGSVNDPRTLGGTISSVDAGQVALAANGGQAPSVAWPDYLFATDVGDDLLLVLSAAVFVGGHLSYVVAD